MAEFVETIIVGAGASGLNCARELAKVGNYNFLVLDQGNSLEKRKCSNSASCRSCSCCNVIYGLGGAGLFSDGKLNLSDKIGGNITSIIDSALYEEYLSYLIETYRLEVKAPAYERYFDLMDTRLKGENVRVELPRQAHFGSDNLPRLIRGIVEPFQGNLLTNCKVQGVSRSNNRYKLITNRGEYSCANLVVAVGQAGAELALTVADQLNIRYSRNKADIGVRLEVKNDALIDLISIQRDPKVYFGTKNGDVRSFCMNPSGFVISENKLGVTTCNGHAMKSESSNNVNVAFMHTVDVESPRKFLFEVGKRISEATNQKLVMQLLDDFLLRQSSTQYGSTLPTNLNYVMGDISNFLPNNTYCAIAEALNILVNGFPELKQMDALLYAPEFKLYTHSIELVNNGFESKCQGAFFIGDCCGHIHGLANAMVSGIACGRNIADRVAAK